MTPKLIIIRGLPGSGKSTMAKAMAGYSLVEADMFFMVQGEYRFVPASVPDAHAWCLAETKRRLFAGESVVVANTFSRIWEMRPYLDLGAAVIEARGRYNNVHGVPVSVIERMAARWEPYPETLNHAAEKSQL